MAGMRVSDDVCERLVASRDPVDPTRLRDEAVADFSRRLCDELMVELGGDVQLRGPAGRLGRMHGFAAGRRRVAAIAAVVLVGVLVAAASLPGGGDHAGPLVVPSASAAVVLDRAAQAALRMASVAPGPGQYGFVQVEAGSVIGTGGSTVGTRRPPWNAWLRVSEIKSDWYAADGAGRERVVRRSASFLRRRDRTVAMAHGMTLARLTGQTFGGRVMDGAFPPRTLLTAGVLPYWKMNHLPTRPTALRTALERLLVASAPNREPGPMLKQMRADPANLFSPISQFLLLPTSPQLRSALFRLLADLPGVRLLGHQRDRLGRTGVAVAITLPGGPDRVREQLVFDPATSNVLQIEFIQLPAGAPSAVRGPNVPAGTVTGYTDFLSRGVVTSITQLPDGRHLPLKSKG